MPRRPPASHAPTGVPPPAAHYCADLAPDPVEIRRTLLEIRALLQPPCGDDLTGRVELVVAEILNNIAEHGGDRDMPPTELQAPRVHVSVAQATGGVFCIVSDVGAAVPAHCLAPRQLPQPIPAEADQASLSEGGFGWFMIQEMARKLYYGREGRRNVLAFLIPKEPVPAPA